MSTPRSSVLRASMLNRTSFAAMICSFEYATLDALLCSLRLCARLAFDQAQNVGFPENEPFLPVDQQVRASPLAEQHAITDLHVERNDPAHVIARAGPGRQYLTLDRLFLRRIGD